MKFKEGDYVKIVTREPTAADLKNCTFYAHFCGLAGVIDRIYEEEVCLKIDQDTLPETVRKRHLDIQDSMKRKWLNGLSGEARNRLTPEEKRFELAYTILVQLADLEKANKPAAPKPEAIKIEKPLNEPAKPATLEDIEAAEEAHLREIEEAQKEQ